MDIDMASARRTGLTSPARRRSRPTVASSRSRPAWARATGPQAKPARRL